MEQSEQITILYKESQMRKPVLLIACSLFLLALPSFGQDQFSVRIMSYPKEVPFGAPIIVLGEFRNISGQPIVVAKGPNGFQISAKVTRLNEKVELRCEEDVIEYFRHRLDSLPSDWSESKLIPLCVPEAGVYSARLLISSEIKEVDQKGVKTVSWKGEIRSEEAIIKVVQPIGIDKEAFEYFKGAPMAKPGALLERYPTSTYASCAIYDCTKGIVRNNWRMVANDVGLPYTGNRSLPDDTGQSKDGWQILTFEQEMAWWDKWIGVVLKNHPDIWFADELKLKRAINLVRQSKYDAGAVDLQVLARDAKEPVAGAAKEFLGIMKEKGWIKAEPAPSTPPPTPVPAKAATPELPTPASAKPPGGGS
jgi:hypothetical protein